MEALSPVCGSGCTQTILLGGNADSAAKSPLCNVIHYENGFAMGWAKREAQLPALVPLEDGRASIPRAHCCSPTRRAHGCGMRTGAGNTAVTAPRSAWCHVWGELGAAGAPCPVQHREGREVSAHRPAEGCRAVHMQNMYF